MQFLARADSDCFHVTTGSDRLGHFHQPHAGNLGNKNLTPMHLLDTANHKPDALLERDPEAGHAEVSDRNLAALALLLEYRNDAATAAQNVSIARATESG